MLVVCNETILNRGVLETRSLPKKFLGRVTLWPRIGGAGLWLRLLAEMQLLRYVVVLSPFVGAPFLSERIALPVSQAPILMLIVAGLVELRVLRLSPAARRRAVDPDEAARRLDALAFRARAALRRIAARHDLKEGEVHLVVEQSELARIAPLTLVSVQAEQPRPHLLPLDQGDRAALAGLFDATLTERDLLAVNHRDNLYVRDIGLAAQAVSAHARLAAYLDKRAAAT